MNTEHDTRDHILSTGEQLCMHKGFTAMGLSELLKTAQVPKGSFYHYFPSKEAFGVFMLERHYAEYYTRLAAHFRHGEGSYRDRLLGYYQYALNQYLEQGHVCSCLTVKLSAEVCDLSEAMRQAMDKGAGDIVSLLAYALDEGRKEGSLTFCGEPLDQARVFYALWLGANLQAKISHSAASLESAIAHVRAIISTPAA